MALKRLVVPSLFCVSIAVGVGACGGDDGGSVQPDASVDDEDASVSEPTQTGRIIMASVSFHNLPAPFDMMGEGILQVVDVQPVAERLPFAYEEAPGAAFGCKVTEFTPEQLAKPPVNLGTLSYTIENGPAFPDCNFVDGVGYQCVGVTGTGGTIGADRKSVV